MFGTIRLRLVFLRSGIAILLCLCLFVICLFALPASDGQSAVTSPESVVLPILMYHSLLPNEANRYIVSPERFENDLRFLKKNGYETVVMQDLLRFVNGEGDLPEKPVMLTFDDGHYNNYYYAYPLLKRYGYKMVFSPIGYCVDLFSEKDGNHIDYSYVTWQQLREMELSGIVEIANHSYNLHNVTANRKGILRSKGESALQYRALLLDDVGGMQKEFFSCLGTLPTTFTYPYGFTHSETLALLKTLGFRATLTCTGFTNRITRNPDCLYELGRYLRPAGIPTQDFFTKTLGFT